MRPNVAPRRSGGKPAAEPPGRQAAASGICATADAKMVSASCQQEMVLLIYQLGQTAAVMREKWRQSLIFLDVERPARQMRLCPIARRHRKCPSIVTVL
jgi:hypothetical protein